MRVLLKLEIDCDADAAWRALHSPRAVAELYGPLIDLAPLDPEGLPTSWAPRRADEPTRMPQAIGVQLRLGGILPLGRQLIQDRVHERGIAAEHMRAVEQHTHSCETGDRR